MLIGIGIGIGGDGFVVGWVWVLDGSFARSEVFIGWLFEIDVVFIEISRNDFRSDFGGVFGLCPALWSWSCGCRCG